MMTSQPLRFHAGATMARPTLAEIEAKSARNRADRKRRALKKWEHQRGLDVPAFLASIKRNTPIDYLAIVEDMRAKSVLFSTAATSIEQLVKSGFLQQPANLDVSKSPTWQKILKGKK